MVYKATAGIPKRTAASPEATNAMFTGMPGEAAFLVGHVEFDAFRPVEQKGRAGRVAVAGTWQTVLTCSCDNEK